MNRKPALLVLLLLLSLLGGRALLNSPANARPAVGAGGAPGVLPAQSEGPAPLQGTPTPTATPNCGWQIVTSPNSVLPNNYLQGIAGLAANDVWAVGFANDYQTPNQTVTMRWDGGNWLLVPSPSIGARTVLYAVAPVATNDVWAVGSYVNGQYFQPYIQRWNGTAWSVVPGLNIANMDAELYGVAVAGRNDVWAVGWAGTFQHYRTLVGHWDGSAWSVVPSPNNGPWDHYLYGVTALAANDVWAVGSYWGGTATMPLTLHWDGALWSTVPSLSPTGGGELRAVAGLTANDVWAVGAGDVGPGGGQGHGLTAHWDGSAWSEVPSPHNWSRTVLRGVAVRAANDIWAVGRYFQLSVGREQTLTEHWDGSTWSEVPSPNGPYNSQLYGVVALGLNDVWAVGYYDGGVSQENTLIQRHTTACPSPTPGPPTATPTPAPPTATPGLPTATATACAIAFTDVDANNPFYPFIRCLACRQIVDGYADGTFRWGNDVTRGQLSKIIAGAAGLTNAVPSTQQTFSDVPNTDPFWLFIERLAGTGAIDGYACGGPGEPCDPQVRPYFRPAHPATRGQITKIVVLAAGFGGIVPTTQQTFADVPSNNPFWVWIETLAARQIIEGYVCGGPGEPCDPEKRPYFRWGANTTRGQMSKIAAQAFYPNCQTPQRAMSNEQ